MGGGEETDAAEGGWRVEEEAGERRVGGEQYMIFLLKKGLIK